MRLSQLFTHTLRENPKDEVTANARLLTRGGFIFKNLAGVYSFLPLGLQVIKKIERIIRGEMAAIGGQELHLNILQDKQVWEKTGRWEEAKAVMYQFRVTSDVFPSTSDVRGQQLGLGFTHEEVVAQIANQYIHSYRDLPKYVYQIQKKFRKELRAQAGLLRGREFVMKDLYSFSATEEQLNEFYETVATAYEKIFERLGLVAYRTEASGGVFSKQFSHEYQVVIDAGEDTIYICKQCQVAKNKEIVGQAGAQCYQCGGKTVEKKAIEVGNIFRLGTRFSEPLGLYYTDRDGHRKPVVMGSYGFGPDRAMGTIVEAHHDDKGILWPENIAPYKVHLIQIPNSKPHTPNKSQAPNPKLQADKLYEQLTTAGIEVLYDDREAVSAGEKFADADLIGCPIRLVVSEKTMERRSVEMKKRGSNDTEIVGLSSVIRKLED